MSRLRQGLGRIAALVLFIYGSTASADSHGPERVVVTNSPANPVPTTIVGAPVPVSGSVNATITNPSLNVTGSVAVTSMPSVTVNGIPPRPFFGYIYNYDGVSTWSTTGTTASAIGVTSVTVTNETSGPLGFTLMNVGLTDPATCGTTAGGPNVISGSWPEVRFIVEGYKTTQFTYPTPLVFNAMNAGGVTCMGYSFVPQGLKVFINGILP
jgi:hypothetical protein